MTKHSKLPWSVNQSSSFTTITSNERDICMMPAVIGRPYSEDDEDKANAQYIVQACNLYPQLVEALRGFKQALAMLEKHDPGTADAIRSEHRAVLAQALV
jgi:hypothetical protein